MTRIQSVSRNGCRNDTSVDDFGRCPVQSSILMAEDSFQVQKITLVSGCKQWFKNKVCRWGWNQTWRKSVLKVNLVSKYMIFFPKISNLSTLLSDWGYFQPGLTTMIHQLERLQPSSLLSLCISDLPHSAYLLLQDGDALVLEGLAELDDLGAFRIDRQRRHDHVGALVHQLANQAVPLFLVWPTKPKKLILLSVCNAFE